MYPWKITIIYILLLYTIIQQKKADTLGTPVSPEMSRKASISHDIALSSPGKENIMSILFVVIRQIPYNS